MLLGLVGTLWQQDKRYTRQCTDALVQPAVSAVPVPDLCTPSKVSEQASSCIAPHPLPLTVLSAVLILSSCLACSSVMESFIRSIRTIFRVHSHSSATHTCEGDIMAPTMYMSLHCPCLLPSHPCLPTLHSLTSNTRCIHGFCNQL